MHKCIAVKVKRDSESNRHKKAPGIILELFL